MKRVVLDSNIIFAALRSADSATRRKLKSSSPFLFYSPNFLIGEIFKYRNHIFKHAKATEPEVLEFLNQVLEKVHFVNEQVISLENYFEAYHLCKDVDPKDTPFVALAIELDAELWTRDEALKQGLRLKGFTRFFDVTELS